MVYRLGERARFHKARHAWRQRRIQTSVLALLCVVLVGLVMMKLNHNSITQALGLSGKHSSNGPSDSPSQPRHTTGSSAPAPKDTPAAAAVKVSAKPTAPSQAGCEGFPAMHPGLSNSSAPELRKLAQYEQLCGGAVAGRTSIFVSTPSTITQAQTSARTTSEKLKAYAQAGISPLIFMEPTDLNGAQLDLAKYATGGYDTALTEYFKALQSTGLTSSGMGMWVYLPEGNLPVWSTTDPSIYAAVVTKMAQLQKQYFPGSQVSLMLDSQSFPVGHSWGDGNYTSLVPYIQGIPKDLIDSFGLQGFPWAAPAKQPSETSLYNPNIYLRTDFAVQAAHTLGTKSIWLNTGTIARMYIGKSGQTVTDTPLQRQEMLDGVIQLAQQTRTQGFNVAIHLFAQNKSSWTEATDWSYWQRSPGDRPDTTVFTAFAHKAQASGIALWLYDSY